MTDESQLERWKLNHTATVSSGAAAVKIVLLINGGSAVAVLAFIGGLAGQGRISTNDIVSVAGGLTAFGYGVLFAAIAGCLGYLTNRAILWEIVHKTKFVAAISIFLQLVTVGSVITSLVCFILGLFEVRDAITHLKIIDPIAIGGTGPG